jgi:hypothetical protein
MDRAPAQGPAPARRQKVVLEQADLEMIKETAPMVKHARPEALSPVEALRYE